MTNFLGLTQKLYLVKVSLLSLKGREKHSHFKTSAKIIHNVIQSLYDIYLYIYIYIFFFLKLIIVPWSHRGWTKVYFTWHLISQGPCMVYLILMCVISCKQTWESLHLNNNIQRTSAELFIPNEWTRIKHLCQELYTQKRVKLEAQSDNWFVSSI